MAERSLIMNGSDSSEEELHAGPPPKSPQLQHERQKTIRKLSGAAVYNSSFQGSWTKKWPCIKPVNGDTKSFQCTVCSKILSCAHQGERDVTRHVATTQHQHKAKTIQGTHPLSFASSSATSTRQKVWMRRPPVHKVKEQLLEKQSKRIKNAYKLHPLAILLLNLLDKFR